MTLVALRRLEDGDQAKKINEKIRELEQKLEEKKLEERTSESSYTINLDDSGNMKGLLVRFLHESNLIQSTSPKIRMSGANLRKVELSDAPIQETNLESAWLTGGNLTNTNLTGVILNNASLQQVKLENTILRGAQLINTDLRNTIIKGDLDLTNANLHNACINEKVKYVKTNISQDTLRNLGARLTDNPLSISCKDIQ